MSRKGSETRTRILDAAEALVLNKGFSATSVDAIQERAGISRGTFFYHFPSKDDLSRSLIERYAVFDRDLTEAFLSRAEKLVSDPAQQLTLFLSLHEEMFAEMQETYPGCLFASYSYEAGLFDADTANIVNRAYEHWRKLVSEKIEQASLAHPPRQPIDTGQLADHIYAIMQGAFILSKLKNDGGIIVAQLRLLRNTIEMIFEIDTQVQP